MHPIFRSLIFLATTALLSSCSSDASSIMFPGTIIFCEHDLHDSYDYIIVGGGLAGMVVANRLSENAERSVLVIEAGILIPDDQEEEILIPGNYYGINKSKYSWGLQTQPIPELKNRTFGINSAKVVGGGSAVNGMFYQRGSKEDYDSWGKLGNPGWDWESLKPYFMKAEHFHPPDPELAKEFGITYDPTVHGTDGPVQVSFPPFIYPQYKVIIDAMKSFGINVPQDAADGNAFGALWAPSSQDPKDKTRSYSKTAYCEHENSVARENYHLITQRHVTKIVLNREKAATGVIFSDGIDGDSTYISARAEVILAAGALHTPKLLQLSGIGPKKLLKAHGIPVIEDSPGVGTNFQDHPSMYTVLDYNINLGAYPDPNYLTTNTTFAAEKLAEFREFGTGPYTISTGNSACFLPLPLIAPKTYTSIIAQSRRAPASSYLRHNTDPAVIAGFTKQKQLLLAAFATNSVAVDEFIVNGDLIPLFALQKPLSRGFVEIASANPFAPPLVQHRTISDPTDLAVFVEMVKHARRFFASSGLAQFTPVETKPGVEVVSDKALREAVVEAMTPTFDHPSCSCPMMPRELGGVVDPLLRVYGVGRLRIVDASIIPIIPGAHLQSTVYAVAEKAADIIKANDDDVGMEPNIPAEK